MRRDARRNRDTLIEAASEIMRTEGDMPMEVICEKAGLTRGTLYRNFPHRQAIYEAVLQRDLENLAHQIAEEADDPLAFIRLTAELMMVYHRFLGQLVEMADYDAEKNQRELAEALAPALARAQQAGLLRADLDAPDILMACRMLASHWRLDDQPDYHAALRKRLGLLIRGLEPDQGRVSSRPASLPPSPKHRQTK